MYLVELRPGKEELYRTGDDLAAAIRRGDVDVHSRIYHRATSKWISITLHPQYKAILAQKPDPLPPMERGSWTYLNAHSETLEGSDPEPDEGEPGTDPLSGGAPPVERSSHPWRRLFALGVAGLALLLGMQLAFSGPRPPWANTVGPQTPALPASGQEEKDRVRGDQVISLASTSAAWDDAVEPETANSPTATPPVATPPMSTPARAIPPAGSALPRAPRIQAKTLGDVLPADAGGPKASDATVEGLLERYAAAHESARERLAAGVRVARLTKLLAASRLTPDGGVTETRLGLAGVANFIRVFRQQQELIEREYQDSFATMAKEHGWSIQALRQWHTRSAPKETPALVELSTNLLFGIDSVLALLTDQAGAYRLGDETIAFEDADASRRYGRMRRQVSAMIDSARMAEGGEPGGPMSHLLRAIGTTRLPREI